MKYARIQNAVAVEIIEPAFSSENLFTAGIASKENPFPDPVLLYAIGQEIPIEHRFHPDLVATMIEIPDDVSVSQGDSYEEGGFVKAAAPLVDLAEQARMVRDSLLRASDWSQLPDVPEALRTPWTAYREALRGVPQQAKFPSKIQWPDAPK